MGFLQLNASKNGVGGGTGTIGGTIAAGQVAYGTAFNTIGGDALFTRAADGDTFLLKSFGGNEVAGVELDTASSGVVIGYFDTATLENATAAFSKGSDIQTIIGYNNPASNIQGNLIFNNAGNTLTWDLDTTDNVTDVITQGADIFGGGIKGTAIYRQDSGSKTQAITIWGDVSPIFGFSEPSIYSGATNSDGTIAVNVVVSPVFDTGITTNYQENNILGQLQLIRAGNTLLWDADDTDTITTGIQQSQDILGLAFGSGSFNYYWDTSTDLVSINGTGDLSASFTDTNTAFLGTINTVNGKVAYISSFYDELATSMAASLHTENGAGVKGTISSTSIETTLDFQAGGGQESFIIANATEVSLNYKLGIASDSYKLLVADALLQFKDDDSNINYFTVNIAGQIVNINPDIVPVFANDAAAALGGLVSGDLYRTTTLGTTALNFLP